MLSSARNACSTACSSVAAAMLVCLVFATVPADAATVGASCAWDTTIGARTVTPDWSTLVESDRVNTLTNSLWSPGSTYELTASNYRIRSTEGYLRRPLSDLGPGGPGWEFGDRLHPISRTWRFHAGFDFGGKRGDPVWALAPGTVTMAGYYGAYGNVVVIDHGEGLSTVSAHLTSMTARTGATVTVGQQIGTVGATGGVTGPHLHFETRLGGVPVNPRYFVADLAPPAAKATPYVTLDHLPDQASASVYRLYVAYFKRCPDAAGFAYWVNGSDKGLSIASISSFFADSPEFRQRYSSDVSNGEFVRLVYQNVMGREPEKQGFEYWIGRLETGLSRGELMSYFSDSPEFRGLTSTL